MHKKRIQNNVKTCGLIFGALYAVLGFAVRIFSKNPLETVHILGANNFLPPIWIFNILCIFWFFACGYAAGIVFGDVILRCPKGTEEIYAYRGGMAFIAMFFLTLIWYPVFFCDIRLFFALIISIASVICSAVCACFWRRDKLASLIMCANSIWLFYILLANLSVILKN